MVFAASLFLSILSAFGESNPIEPQVQPTVDLNDKLLNENDVATVNAAYMYKYKVANNTPLDGNKSNETNQINETNQSSDNNQNTEIQTRPVYITSDNINSITEDNGRVNEIVNGLKAKGVYAVNYGIGPNEHDAVLQDVPSNALIVDIYGGACAGTLYEMGTPWYKETKGNKKVFTIFYSTSVQITGLNWLPRSHDDYFSPSSFTGITDPGQYMLNNGYNYTETGDVQSMIDNVYNEACV